MKSSRTYTSMELCAGAGGQALGLHLAGFQHKLLVEIDGDACKTLELNNAKSHLKWEAISRRDVIEFSNNGVAKYEGIDLVAGGVPCPPFSIAGKQLGQDDERDLFPAALRVVAKSKPRAVMLENVRGLLDPKFSAYREHIDSTLKKLGYETSWRLLNACEYGVPQLRPRVILVAAKPEIMQFFEWPTPVRKSPSVGDALFDLMASNGWMGAQGWREKAQSIAPTIVGGSKKHGGPDLGPTRAKREWLKLGINGCIIANEPPSADLPSVSENVKEMPSLTVRMAARVQGFPDWWEFYGKKTTAYRQVGNAFPPPVACAVGKQLIKALRRYDEGRD
jgi:DNA (cytosine-5)-methyltransferase 1